MLEENQDTVNKTLAGIRTVNPILIRSQRESPIFQNTNPQFQLYQGHLFQENASTCGPLEEAKNAKLHGQGYLCVSFTTFPVEPWGNFIGLNLWNLLYSRQRPAEPVRTWLVWGFRINEPPVCDFSVTYANAQNKDKHMVVTMQSHGECFSGIQGNWQPPPCAIKWGMQ